MTGPKRRGVDKELVGQGGQTQGRRDLHTVSSQRRQRRALAADQARVGRLRGAEIDDERHQSKWSSMTC